MATNEPQDEDFDPLANHTLLTKQTMHYFMEGAGPLSAMGYIAATRDINEKLKEMLDTCSTFEELKHQLTSFYQDREEFHKYSSRIRFPKE